jgi:hypothetical protein
MKLLITLLLLCALCLAGYAPRALYAMETLPSAADKTSQEDTAEEGAEEEVQQADYPTQEPVIEPVDETHPMTEGENKFPITEGPDISEGKPAPGQE